MEYLESEDSIVRRLRKMEDEPLVPNGSSIAGIIGLSGSPVVRVNPKDDIGLEIAVMPIDIFQVLGGDDGDLEIVGFRWRARRRTSCHG